MVQLIKIDRLGPRIEGMLYRKKFEETWSLLDDVSSYEYFLSLVTNKAIQSARKLSEAGNSLLHAKHFKELFSVSTLSPNLARKINFRAVDPAHW